MQPDQQTQTRDHQESEQTLHPHRRTSEGSKCYIYICIYLYLPLEYLSHLTALDFSVYVFVCERVCVYV